MAPTARKSSGVVDGRRARREQSRAAAVDALFQLVNEGVIPPSAQDIAARAGVSTSSLYRYFDSIDDLLRQAMDTFLEQVIPALELPAPEGRTLDARLTALVDLRLDLFEQVAGVARVARSRAVEHPDMGATIDHMRTLYAAQVRAQLAPECASLTPAAGDDLVVLVETLLSFESWEILSDVHHRSRGQIRRAWLLGATRLCQP